MTFIIPSESGDLDFWNPFPANRMDMNDGLDLFPGAEGRGEIAFMDVANIEQAYTIARKAINQAKSAARSRYE